MGFIRKWHWYFLIAILLGGVFFQLTLFHRAAAQDSEENPSGGRRTTKITVTFTRHKWWLIRWSNNQIACAFYSEQEGLPALADVEGQCDKKVFDEWRATKPCNLAEVASTTQCPGLYLQLIETTTQEREIELELPTPKVWVSIDNCNPQPPENRCTTLPNLVLTGEEPLPNEIIVSIQGTIAGVPFTCGGDVCVIPLQPTGLDGITVEFWADSSFGDSSERYTAKVRLIPWGDFMNPEEPSAETPQYYVDVLSSQWQGGPAASCSDIWQTFPDIGGPPAWLTTPQSVEELRSEESYYYLAGALITYGIVDAGACLDGGLQAPNIASACGVEAARPQLAEWQNRFDNEIMQASQDTGIPARLLKSVFSRESQIWPGIFRTYKEAGLGQLVGEVVGDHPEKRIAQREDRNAHLAAAGGRLGRSGAIPRGCRAGGGLRHPGSAAASCPQHQAPQGDQPGGKRDIGSLCLKETIQTCPSIPHRRCAPRWGKRCAAREENVHHKGRPSSAPVPAARSAGRVALA